MTKANFNIEIEVNKIKVDKRYFSFDYEVKVNGQLKLQRDFCDNYDGENKDDMKKKLKEGYAAELILENHVSEIF